MSTGINDLDFDDEVIEEGGFGEPVNYDEPYQETNDDDNAVYDSGELIQEILTRKGVNDLNNITIQKDDGQLAKVSWNDLNPQEQLEILSSTEEIVEDGGLLGADYYDLATQLESQGLTLQDYITQLKQEGVNEYLQSQQLAPSYEVDTFTDDELFIVDFQSKVPDATEEDIEEALYLAKSNPSLYARQVAGLREEYRELENQENIQKQAILEEQQQASFNEFAGGVLNIINSLDNVGGIDIELEDEDKQELADFILQRDAAGVSYLGKALNNPETLVRMAWFALRGQEAIDGLTNYFTQEIANVRDYAYRQGLADGGKQQQNRPRVLTTQQGNNNRKAASIDDLD